MSPRQRNLRPDDHYYSPTATSSSFRAFCQVVAHEDLEAERWDVNQAFLQADIDRVTFIEQAEGFVVVGKEGWVVRLNRSLYGLRQANRISLRLLTA